MRDSTRSDHSSQLIRSLAIVIDDGELASCRHPFADNGKDVLTLASSAHNDATYPLSQRRSTAQ
jgi:hypothetical protein